MKTLIPYIKIWKIFSTDSFNSNEFILIEEEITSDEILVRYIFSDDFKNKLVKAESVITKELLGPLRGGTSLQREKYCDEQKCYKLGNLIPKKELVGFLVFKKIDFEKVKNEFILSKDNEIEQKLIDAFIKATPLDENFNLLDFNKTRITIKTKGNPSHADIIYIKPKLIPEESNIYEKPNTIIRSFSKKMYLMSKLILIDNKRSNFEIQKKFREYFE